VNENSAVDIAVVGGGLVGAPLAIMLASLGWKVALVEKAASTEQLTPGSRGYTALSDATVQLLSAHGLWARAAEDACAIEQVHVSHKGYFGSTHIDCRDHRVDALGYVVDNSLFGTVLRSQLESRGVQLFELTHVQQADYHQDHAVLQCHRGDTVISIESKLVVAVDGVDSELRSGAGIESHTTDYDQIGVLGLVQLAQDHEHVAYERFTPSGPLALLPRPDKRASFVYCVEPDRRHELMSMSDSEFISHLQNEFGFRLGRFKHIESRVVVPLVRVEAEKQTSQRLLLLGNSLRLLHPVAGQGYNLAMRDVQSLLRQLEDTSIDPGDGEMLKQFALSREDDHKRVVGLTDFLARAFRGKASLPAHARALALLGLDRLPPLKKRFTEQSMGYV